MNTVAERKDAGSTQPWAEQSAVADGARTAGSNPARVHQFDDLLKEVVSPKKNPKRISPTQLSLKWFRARGMKCAVTERWVKTPAGGFRLDVFAGDLLVLLRNEIINVQAGTAAHHAAKITKAIEHPDCALWLAAPTRKFQIWTWGKRQAFKKNGKPRKLPRWTPRVTEIRLENGIMKAYPFILK